MKQLASIELQETANLELVQPKTGDGLGVFFILAGPEHPTRKRIELEKDRKMRRQINRKGTLELEDPEEDRKQLLEYLTNCTLGWYSIETAGEGDNKVDKRVDAIDVGAGPVPFSLDKAREIYSTARLAWIKQQVREGLNKQEVFISDSSRGSSAGPAGSPV